MSSTRNSIATVVLAALLPIAVGAKFSDDAVIRRSISYEPVRFTFKNLVDNHDDDAKITRDLHQALTEVGMISVTDIPSFTNKDVLDSLHDCIMQSAATVEHVFGDGTRRRTLATHSVPNGIQSIQHDAGDASCDRFDQVSLPFRSSASKLAHAFAHRLETMFGKEDMMTKPLLATSEGFAFEGLPEVVAAGEHLEHFHSYEKPPHAEATYEDADEDVTDAGTTIEWHTDQGLFLVFTPARWTDGSLVDNGFSIQLADGSTPTVQFSEQDELVILLGDGVNQYVNPKMTNQQANKALRALPHALRMPQHDRSADGTTEQHHRVWYGRMVLPPASALHPEHKMTFGELRSRMIDHDDDEDEETMRMGCSSSDMRARQLEGISCEEGTLLCWHRCMSLADEGLTVTTCADQGLSLFCQNPRGQLWTGFHGDYYPGCVNLTTAENHTAFPPLPEAPRDEVECSHDAFAFHRQAQKTQYDNERVLEENTAVFQWSVDEATQEVRGNLVVNALFGWLAIGFANVGGPKNGMHGSEIILAIPGGDYNAVDGLNLTYPTNVREYVINPHPAKASFRHWSTPATSADSMTGSYSVVETAGCFTSLQFVATEIQGRAFNLSGTDEMIWAFNGEDYYVGYHTARGRFRASWPEDTVTLFGEEEETGNGEGDDPTESTVAENEETSSGIALVLGCSAVTSVLAWAVTMGLM